MTARVTRVRGGKVEIQKKHTQIYILTNFQNFGKILQVTPFLLPNGWSITVITKDIFGQIED